jgi:hypothetical protein
LCAFGRFRARIARRRLPVALATGWGETACAERLPIEREVLVLEHLDSAAAVPYLQGFTIGLAPGELQTPVRPVPRA